MSAERMKAINLGVCRGTRHADAEGGSPGEVRTDSATRIDSFSRSFKNSPLPGWDVASEVGEGSSGGQGRVLGGARRTWRKAGPARHPGPPWAASTPGPAVPNGVFAQLSFGKMKAGRKLLAERVQGKCILHAQYCCAVFLYGAHPKKGCFSAGGPTRSQCSPPQNRAFCRSPTAGGVRPCVRCRAAGGDPRLWVASLSEIPRQPGGGRGAVSRAQRNLRALPAVLSRSGGDFLSLHGGQCPPKATGRKEGNQGRAGPKVTAAWPAPGRAEKSPSFDKA